MSNTNQILLKDVIDLKHGHQFRDEDFVKEGVGVIKIGNVWDKGLDLENLSYVSEKRLSEFDHYMIHNGDILMSLTGNIGRVVEVKNLSEPLLQNYRVGNFFSKNENLLIRPFIKWILSSESILRQLEKYSNKSAQANFGKQDLEKLVFAIPSVPKQKKIAKILSTFDEVIKKTEAAIEKYKIIKEGMMQDLFTRGIDVSTGKLRPKYEDAPELYKETELGWIPREWEEVRLDKCLENLDGKRVPIKKEDRENIKGEIPYYGASGVIDYVDDYIFNEPLILLGEDGENVVSRNQPLAFIIDGKSWVNNHAHVLRPIPPNNLLFFCELLESIDYSAIVSGSAQPKITQSKLNNLLLPRPEPNEQKQISLRIQAVIDTIHKEVISLEKYNSLKKGLMQDLLTGKMKVQVDEKELQE